MARSVDLATWTDALEFLRTQPRHTIVRVPHSTAKGHPRDWPGMQRSLGLSRGQIADYRLRGRDGGDLHVIEYPEYFDCHYDAVSPNVNLLKHLRVDVFG
jgi:hypothetical protein